MFLKIQTYWSKNQSQFTDIRNIGLCIFALIVIAIAWSTARTIQSNYDLQKQVSVLKQQNAVLELQNQNADLENKYYETNQYLDLAARQNLGLAAPGEQVLIVPNSVAMKYVDSSIVRNQAPAPAVVDKPSKYVKNVEDWRDFLLGRKPSED